MINGRPIAICGCGTAGLAAALALAPTGAAITLFDQFDTPRPLGSGLILQPAGLAVLDWLKAGERIRRLGARIDRLYGKACGSERIVLDVRYAALDAEMHGVAVHRGALFGALFDLVAQQGIRVETRCRVQGLSRDAAGCPILTMADARRFGPFDLVIDATGSNSPLLDQAAAPVRRAGLPYGALWASLPWPGAPFDPHALEQRYQQASVMIGVLPIGRQTESGGDLAAFFWSIKTKDHSAWLRRGLDPWKDEVRRLWPACAPLLDQITRPDQMVLASYAHHTLPVPFGERIVFIGDSAHSTSPQLGQGANMALIDVAALTHALQSGGDMHEALARYARLRRAHVRLFQGLSRVFTPFYQSDSMVLPLLRDYLVAPMSRVPGVPRVLANIVSGRINDPLGFFEGPVRKELS